MPDSLTRDAALELLRFYSDSGVDVALGEEGLDRFALSLEHRRAAELPAEAGAAGQSAGRPASPPLSREHSAPGSTVDRPPGGAAPAPQPAVPSAGAVMAAREAAGAASSLDELRAILAGFEGCNLRFTATNLVFGDGDPNARLMLVGEAPGLEEDLHGIPFVGRSGQLLDRMLAAIGLARGAVYIANVVPWRPPGNRKPTPQETEICRPFIERQIALVDPDILVLLGDAATKQLFKTMTGISKVRGQWRPYQTGLREIRALATFHPAYLLRTPLAKRLAWRDLLMLQAGVERE